MGLTNARSGGMLCPRHAAKPALAWVPLTLWALANASLAAAPKAVPEWRYPLFREDGLVETATALLFFLGFVIGAGRLMTRGPTTYRFALPIFSGLSLLCWLDEISFGARIFGLRMPAMKAGGEFDGAHDAFVLAYRVLAERGSAGAALPLVCALLLVAFVAVRWRSPLRRLAKQVVGDAAYALVGASLLLLSIAMVIDLGVGVLARLTTLEELCELNAAALLLLAVAAMSSQRIHRRCRRLVLRSA